MANIVLTCYLTARPDPQRGLLWPTDDDETVRTWIKSVQRCHLRAVIFHDDLSPGFIGRWTSDAVQFERVEWKTPFAWSALEERIRIYRDYLQDHEFDYAVTTDLSDVEFYHDPFPLMGDPHAIYIGSELHQLGQTCVAEWMMRAYHSLVYSDRQLLNAGIIGGRRPTLVHFFNRYLSELTFALIGTQPPVDMAAFNRLIQREKISYVTGYPLHTVFRKNEGPQSGAAIRHK